MNVTKNICKVIRYIRLYGFSRTVVKIAGRTRNHRLRIFFPKKKAQRDVSLIGCGQFGFSTISYFLYKNRGSCFCYCYDTDAKNSISAARFWGYRPVRDYRSILSDPACKYVYIASDHYSHSQYAIEALKAGKIVCCEKPVSVTSHQLDQLVHTIRECSGEIYFGYNRPFSQAAEDLGTCIRDLKQPVTLTCFISGHKLAPEHWYNDPKEGTRICGNLGHWIDLSLYLFEVRGYIPQKYEIQITYADEKEKDDNLSVSYKTDFGDLVTIVLTSRTEPFEGINETVCLQCGHVISKIDDFTRQTIWIDEKKKQFRYRPKDVGHLKSVNQPFLKEKRKMETVIQSTRLMLEVKAMAEEGRQTGIFQLLLPAHDSLS